MGRSKPKKPWVAMLLVFLFGPFGLIYASWLGSTTIIASMVAYNIIVRQFDGAGSEWRYYGVTFFWLVSFAWALISIKKYNRSCVWLISDITYKTDSLWNCPKCGHSNSVANHLMCCNCNSPRAQDIS